VDLGKANGRAETGRANLRYGTGKGAAQAALRQATPPGIAPGRERWHSDAVPFKLQPTLTGPLLQLRPLTSADYDNLYAVAADPKIWEQHPDRTRWQPAGFRTYFEQAIASGGALIASSAESGTVIGASRFHGYDAVASEIEIGWTFLARKYWGGRYNREMKRLMVEHAFGFAQRVVLRIGRDNIRSQNAALKIGAVFAGSATDGLGNESYAYHLSADAWARAASQPSLPLNT
jgi:N-acetyltransferase